jgi:ribosomal protein L24E
VYDQPFTDGQCVYAEYEVREYREYPNDDDRDDEWKTVETGSFATAFEVEDNTGRMLVDPNGETLYEISDRNETLVKVGKNSTPPVTRSWLIGSLPRIGRITR